MHRGCNPQPTTPANLTDSPPELFTPVTLATSGIALTTSPTTPSSTISELPSPRSGSISTSSILSEDPYKEKLENLGQVVQQLQDQLILERLKNKGASTLAACLKEEREENTSLRRDLEILQTRLAATQKLAYYNRNMDGAQAMDVSNSAMAEPSTVMKQMLQLQQEKTQLQQEKTKLQEEVTQLRILHSTPTEKDQEISRLNKCNADLTESMSQQTSMLQMKLKQTADMCQHLAGQLDQGMGGQRVVTKMAQDFTQLQVNGHDGLQQENDKLKDQVTTLNQQLQEVIDMNTRWQTYNKQREDHITQLKHKLKDMEDKLAASDKPLQLSEQQQAEIDRLILQYKQKVEVTEEDKVKLADENRELRLQLDRTMAGDMEKENTIKTLQDQLTRVQIAGGSSRQDTERIQMLEHQVQLCTEDFESERHDRERSQAKVEEMEQELRIVRRQLEQFQGRQMDEISERRRSAMQYYREEYERQHPGYQNVGVPQLVARGMVQADCVEDAPEEDGEGYDTIDCGPDMVRRFEAGESALQRAEPEDTLQCPKCKKEFPISQHEQLLEHTEECI